MKTVTSFFVLVIFTLVVITQFPKGLCAQTKWLHYSDQPVIEIGAASQWDQIGIFQPMVIKDGDTLRMWYTSYSTFKIGYAWSTDGINWTKYEGNPILSGVLPWESNKCAKCAVIKDGDTLKMWYGAGGAIGSPPVKIGYATSLNGKSWTKYSDPVLTTGPPGEWDYNYITPGSVIKEDTIYKMWYWGAQGHLPTAIAQIGLATSHDGINWTKYDDPSTTSSPFAVSDPVLKKGGQTDWDGMRTWMQSVMSTEWGYEMWYAGVDNDFTNQWIGYATSTDGIVWTRWSTNPVIPTNPAWAGGFGYCGNSVLKYDDLYHMWYACFKTGSGSDLRIGYAIDLGNVPHADSVAVSPRYTIPQVDTV